MTVIEVRQDALPEFDDFVAAEGEGLLRLAYLLTTEEEPAAAVLEDALARTYGCWPRLTAASANPQDYVRRLLVQEVTESHRLRRSPAPVEPADTDDDLVVALRALPPDERAATVLRHCLDLSEMETAATLGCTVGAVRRQTMRALSQLRDLLPGLAPATRPAAHSLVELMRHLQASLAALPDRLDLRPAPELLRNIRRSHARRALRRRTVLATAASVATIIAFIVLQVATGGGLSV
ncbi:MAG: sigma factor-like helix-turn-helix DNA-binding protein [Mycobacteriales bacterium]